VAAPAPAFGRECESMRDEPGCFRGEGDLGFDGYATGRVEGYVTESGCGTVDLELEGVREPIAHVGAAPREAVAPVGEVEARLLSESHVDAALTDTFAAHAREIGLAADLEREAAVEDVVPHVPFGKARRVHGADE